MLKYELNEARKAGNSETKSSAGDKHETGRAMAQLEQENLLKQIGKHQGDLGLLRRIKTVRNKEVSLGSLVITSQMNFYISIPLGTIALEGTEVMCISRQSPLVQAMKGFGPGAELTFNGGQIRIEEVI